MTAAERLVAGLRDPGAVVLDAAGWTELLTVARAESLLGTLAHRLEQYAVPDAVAPLLADARAGAEEQRVAALWEAEMARRALALGGIVPILLKGTAYAAAGLSAGAGRSIGDLDILVPRDRLAEAERLLLAAGWGWIKPDAYDDHYYRTWMHELPPLLHAVRDRMIDVHHTILPPTARPTPDAALLVADSVTVAGGWRVPCAHDRIVHCAAHLLADGDLAGGLRNLWDLRCLLAGEDRAAVLARAARHGLRREVARGMRLADAIYGEGARLALTDRLFVRRLLARDGWGRATRPVTRAGFYLRSHWIRMPPLLLARHLWTKWRGG